MKSDLPLCPVCRDGHLFPAVRARSFQPHGKTVKVELLTSKCDHCGEETTRAAQHAQNLQRLAARKAHYGDLLLGEEILALRKRYGFKQQDASRIFGKGKIAFSRYENETSYPDLSTTLLLQLAIDKPSVLKLLADKAGVEVPLWAERCEDEQHVKLRKLTPVFADTAASPKRYERYTANVNVNVHALRGIAVQAWSTTVLVPTRQTLKVSEASNDERLEPEAIAS